jgi:sodium transport system permease protein
MTRDVVLVVPPTYPVDFGAGRPAAIQIVTDASRTSAAGERARVEGALEGYSQRVGALRLLARGVSPWVVAPVVIEVDDVAPPEAEAATALGVIPMMLLMAVFFGGIAIAVDVTAGERERSSLEPLMSTPVDAASIVLGKLGAVVLFAFGAMLVALVGFVLVIHLAPLPELPGFKLKLDGLGSLRIVAALVPLLLPVAAAQMLVADRGRTTREAYNAASLLSAFAPMVPGMFVLLVPVKSTLSSMMIPVFGQGLLVHEVLRGGSFQLRDYVVAATSSLALGAALAALAVVRGARA